MCRNPVPPLSCRHREDVADTPAAADLGPPGLDPPCRSHSADLQAAPAASSTPPSRPGADERRRQPAVRSIHHHRTTTSANQCRRGRPRPKPPTARVAEKQAHTAIMPLLRAEPARSRHGSRRKSHALARRGRPASAPCAREGRGIPATAGAYRALPGDALWQRRGREGRYTIVHPRCMLYMLPYDRAQL